ENLDSQATSLGFIKSSSLSGYLPLTGGTMTGNIDFETNGTGLYFGGNFRIRFSSASTIIAGASDGIQFRPTSYPNSSDAITFEPGGQINTTNHGNSSQWKQAYDWGDFRDYGLGTNAIIKTGSYDDISENAFIYGPNLTDGPVG